MTNPNEQHPDNPYFPPGQQVPPPPGWNAGPPSMPLQYPPQAPSTVPLWQSGSPPPYTNVPGSKNQGGFFAALGRLPLVGKIALGFGGVIFLCLACSICTLSLGV